MNSLLAKTKIEIEMSQLEKSALQAQMNPHFIFNSLNSIQNFILTNEKEQAMEYLSKFAKLIRQYLLASTEPTISLDEEISMLQKYMDLEQLRFNHSFEYNIDIVPKTEPFEIEIPTMLIQPYVENAILHGVKNLTIKGQVNLKFKKESNILFVCIQDNGSGIDYSHKKENKSFGMSITQQRLKHINQTTNTKYQIKTISNHLGTEINITIKLNQLK